MTEAVTHRTAPSNCPVCGYRIDAATDLDGDATPSPGDFSLCINCASVLVFDDRLQLANPTHDQLREAPPGLWAVQQEVKLVARVQPRYERLPCGCMAGTEESDDGERTFVFIPHAMDCDMYEHVKQEMAKSGKPMITVDAR